MRETDAGIDLHATIAARSADRRPASRVGRAPFVGRAGELAAAREAIAFAFAGTPRALLFTGEAGIGKSRLLRETIAFARLADPRTSLLLGSCLDEQGVPPYLPWLAALRGGRDAPAADLGPLLARLDGGADPTPVAPDRQAFRLFADVTRAIERLAERGPVVLALDDLQWSDAASLGLLRFLLIHVAPIPLLVLGAYRAEEAAGCPDLRRSVAELERRRLVTAVPVPSLAAADTRRLLAGLVAAEPPAALAAAIHAHCEGNPFFVEEVVRALDREGALAERSPEPGETPDPLPTPIRLPLPPGVTDVIARRLQRLAAPCRAVLEAAALLGREVAIDAVAEAVAVEPATVADRLAEAVAAALLRPAGAEEPAADYAFLHDRVRETVAAGINPVRRRDLHARIAAVLAEGPASLGRLAALAHHLRLAGRHGAAATASVRLGEAAMRAHAYDEATAAFRAAVDLARSASPLGADLPAEGDLLLRLGEAALAAGDGGAGAALAAAESAYAIAGDERGLARALHRLGTLHARHEAFGPALDAFERALALLGRLRRRAAPGDRPAIETETAEVLVALSGVRGLSLGEYDAAVAVGRRALGIARRHGRDAPALELRARLALANTLMRAGRLAEGAALLTERQNDAPAASDPTLAAEVAGALANYHYWVGDLDASAAAARRRQTLAVAGGDPYALRHALAWQAFLAASRGEWEAAERLLEEAEAHVDRVDSAEPRAFLRKIRGFCLLHQGRYAEAAAALEEAIAGFRPSGPATLVWYLGCLATASEAAGDAAAADRIAAETADLLAALPAGALPRAPAAAELGIVAALRGDRAAAARWYAELRPFAGQLHWVATDRVLGMLAALLGDLAAARSHFDAAATLADRGGIRPELALIDAERGTALARSPDPADRAVAASSLERALARLRSLGMTGDAGRVAGLLRDLEGRAPSRSLPAGLSAREAEVLALVAQGLTNREIGDRLGISGKTVTNHLTHLFTKADLGNRSAAVAFAVRHGLA